MPFFKGQVGYWKGKKRPDISRNQTGRKLSEEHKKKISIAHTGKKLSAEHIAKCTAKLLGHTTSEATKRKIGDANRGEKCGSWKGDNVKYRGLHTWIVKNWGKADYCERCGSNIKVEWHNANSTYKNEYEKWKDKRNRNEWEKVCRDCHNKITHHKNYELRRVC